MTTDRWDSHSECGRYPFAKELNPGMACQKENEEVDSIRAGLVAGEHEEEDISENGAWRKNSLRVFVECSTRPDNQIFPASIRHV